VIRIVCCEADVGVAANLGGSVQFRYKTFDVELPQVEDWLRGQGARYVERTVSGIEVRAESVGISPNQS